jgi:hypothetical protein
MSFTNPSEVTFNISAKEKSAVVIGWNTNTNLNKKETIR